MLRLTSAIPVDSAGHFVASVVPVNTDTNLTEVDVVAAEQASFFGTSMSVAPGSMQSPALTLYRRQTRLSGWSVSLPST